MELTLEILLHFIADLHPECINMPADPGLFVGVKRFYAGMETEEADGSRYLYVAGPEELAENRGRLTEDMTVLTVREREEPGLPCPLIIVEEDCPLPYLLNRMIDVFSVMANCDKAMHIAALEGQSVQALLDLCEDLLGHPTIIFDSGFDVLAYTRHVPCEYELFRETIRNGYTDYDVMQKLQANRIFSHLEEGKPLVAPAMGAEEQTNIYLKFSGEQALLGYASVYFGDEVPDRGYLDMLGLFMENVRFCLKRDFEGSHYGQMMYETFLLNLMNPAGLSDERLEEQAKNIGNVSLTGRFVLAVIEFSGEEVPIRFLTRILAREMWDVKPFIYNGRICLLKTMSDDAAADNLITGWEMENIVRLLGDREFAMGVSNAFTELKDLRFAFAQARAALELRNENDRYVLYGDIYYDHMFSLMEREMPLSSLQPEFYRQMKDYDAEHGTEYLSIILTYLKCDCNATHTAEQMYLHRNTVHNAVQFVEEHWGISLEDQEIKEKLLTSDLIDRYIEKTS